MLRVLFALLSVILIINTVMADPDENEPGRMYTSGLEFCDDCGPRNYTAISSFAVVRIPFNFKYNSYNKSLPAGFYQLQPVLKDCKPALINIRKNGKVLGTMTISSFKQLKYTKGQATADFELINNEGTGQIILKTENFEVYSLVQRASTF